MRGIPVMRWLQVMSHGLFAALCAGAGCGIAQAAEATHPNVVLIVADDLGWNDIGYHNAEIKSPHLDRLAAEGVRLDQHYVQPQCTPTRVALMTGRYPSRFGRHCTQASNVRALPPGTQTLASLLRSAGYATALTGKWHLGSKPEWGPNHYGFDHSHGSLAGAVGMYDHRYRLTQPEYTRTWHRNHEFVTEEGHVTDLCAAEAVRWIETHAEQPYLLYVPLHAVHVPLVEEDEWLAMNAHIKSPDRRLFAAAVSHMDAAIGRIVDALDRTGQRERTLIVFMSDNGGLHNHRGDTYPPPDPKLTNFSSNLPLRGQKGRTYEGGIRVPALVNWPGRLKPRMVAAPMHAVDWLPTLAGLAGAEPDRDIVYDGRDIWPLLTGDETAPPERTLYWVWGENRRRVALRHGDWKIVRQDGQDEFELFNLADDPSETTDLAATKPEKLAELVALFAAEKAKDAL